MSWIEIRNARPNIPTSLLFFILKEYENGRELRDAPQWIPNESAIIRGDRKDKSFCTSTCSQFSSIHIFLSILAIEAVNDYVRTWQEAERLYVCSKNQITEPIYRPPDLATLFSTARSKLVVESYDSALGLFKMHIDLIFVLYLKLISSYVF